MASGKVCPKCSTRLRWHEDVATMGSKVRCMDCGLYGKGNSAVDAYKDLCDRHGRFSAEVDQETLQRMASQEDLLKRKGFKFMAEVPGGQQCVDMCQFKDTLYLATTNMVYYLDKDNRLRPVEFVSDDGGDDDGE